MNEKTKDFKIRHVMSKLRNIPIDISLKSKDSKDVIIKNNGSFESYLNIEKKRRGF